MPPIYHWRTANEVGGIRLQHFTEQAGVCIRMYKIYTEVDAAHEWTQKR